MDRLTLWLSIKVVVCQVLFFVGWFVLTRLKKMQIVGFRNSFLEFYLSAWRSPDLNIIQILIQRLSKELLVLSSVFLPLLSCLLLEAGPSQTLVRLKVFRNVYFPLLWTGAIFLEISWWLQHTSTNTPRHTHILSHYPTQSQGGFLGLMFNREKLDCTINFSSFRRHCGLL